MTWEELQNLFAGFVILNVQNLPRQVLAKDLGIPPSRVNDIIKGRRSISADTAIRLGLFFKMSPEFWLNAQVNYDLRLVKKNRQMIKTEVHPHAA